ncbi:MAG: efflux RND transporter periplasmic adaptor subunit [Peptostreptococcaceae bacterium]|jgi:RND family efflux transporter MFP subunit|nr:efflux RND transporter periplasmic adaptor subunit [Peptostreptococcaceae bacterium]
MRNKYFKLALFLMLIITLVTGCSKKEEIKKEEKLTRVEVKKPEIRDINVFTTFSGKMNPIDEVKVVSKVSGKVESLNVEIGDRVSQNQILFTIDKEDIKKEYDISKAGYDVALANYNKALENYDLANTNYERMKSLYEEGAISKQEFENYEIGASNTNLELMQAQLNQSNVSLENAKKRLDDTNIKSPIDGVITNIEINKGENINAMNGVITVANFDEVEVQIELTENIINKVNVMDDVDVSINSLGDKNFKGKIYALSPATTRDSFTYPAKIRIKNKNQLIKPGMFAEIKLKTEEKKNVLSIKSDNIIVKNNEIYTFVIEENTAIKKIVELGLDNGEFVEIINGLNENDLVVTSGQNYLDDNSKVEILTEDKNEKEQAENK